jgi:hypothetical protein
VFGLAAGSPNDLATGDSRLRLETAVCFTLVVVFMKRAAGLAKGLLRHWSEVWKAQSSLNGLQNRF